MKYMMMVYSKESAMEGMDCAKATDRACKKTKRGDPIRGGYNSIRGSYNPIGIIQSCLFRI